MARRKGFTLKGMAANAFVAQALRASGDHEAAQRIDPMALPAGESCGTCVHIDRCLGLGFTPHRDRTSCDFHPIRFVKATP